MSVPALRFREFSGEWEVKILGEMTDTITSGSRDWAKYYSNSGCKFIRMTNLNRDGIQLKLDDLRFVDIKSSSSDGERTSLVQGDILMSITAELGKIGWIPSNFGKAFINQHTALIRIKRTSANSIFVAHLLSTKKLNKQINGLNDAGAKAGLNLPTIKSICLTLPSLPEQTKIANFLTAVDQKISLLTQKASLLSQYKKGVMQQIFKQELRFKDDDGQEFPEWEESELGKVSIIIMGQSPDSKSYNDIDEGQPLIQGNADISNRKTNPRIWTSQPTKECKINDIILTVRAPVGAVAKSYHNACIGRGVCAIRNIDKGTTNFIYQLLLWFEPTKWVSLEQGSTFTAVNSNDIKTLTIPVPCLKEQTKIANFLTAIDEKITNNKTQLNALKQYKQGLLQQMFV